MINIYCDATMPSIDPLLIMHSSYPSSAASISALVVFALVLCAFPEFDLYNVFSSMSGLVA